MEKQLFKGNYSGVLIDENYLEFVEKIKQKGKKYGIIRWYNYYNNENLKRIMKENKTVKFGAETLANIEKELDAIFA